MGRPHQCNDCCCQCGDNFPQTWELAVAGVADDDCTNCPGIYNGTFCLSRSADCNFESSGVNGARCSCSASFRLAKIELEINDPVLASPATAVFVTLCDLDPAGRYGINDSNCAQKTLTQNLGSIESCQFVGSTCVVKPVGGSGPYDPGCPICTGGGTGAWEVTLAGIAAHATPKCSQEKCDALNGVYTLPYDRSSGKPSCIYSVNHNVFCDSGVDTAIDPVWQMILDEPAGKWWLRAYPESGGTYTALYCLSIADFDWCGPNVFSKISNTTECGSWPSTLTVDATAC